MSILLLTFTRSILIAFAVMVLSCSRLSAAARLQVSGETMGTYFLVTIDSPPGGDTEASVRAEILTKLSQIDSQMSTWDSESEISGFNRSDSTEWYPVAAEFAAVVQEAKRVHHLSGGAFDPTVSPLIDLWGFGKPDRHEVPDETAIHDALRAVGMQHLAVRTEPPAIRRNRAGVQLNLSAIAKGYAVDAIAELLTRSGRSSFTVDIGGEIKAGTAKASGDPWRIGIESPRSRLSRKTPPTRIVPITEAAVATSGDYRNYYESNGTVYSHTINPVTGRPVENPPASVTVIHDSCMTADALATAMMVLGRDEGIQLAEKQHYSVLFQIAGSDGRMTQVGTGRFADESTEKSNASESWVVFLAAGALFLMAVGGMAIGILIGNREIKGSCGGLASMPGSESKSICELCSIPRDECVNEELREQLKEAGGSPDSRPDCPDGSPIQSQRGTG